MATTANGHASECSALFLPCPALPAHLPARHRSYVDGENVAITSLTIILEPFGSDLKHFFGRNGLNSQHLNARPCFCLVRHCRHIFLDGFFFRPRERGLGRHRTACADEPASLPLDLAPRPERAILLAPRCILTADLSGARGGHRHQNDGCSDTLH